MEEKRSAPKLVISTCGILLLNKASRDWRNLSPRDLGRALDDAVANDPSDDHIKLCPEIQSLITLQRDEIIDLERDYFSFIVTRSEVAAAVSRVIRLLGIGERVLKIKEIEGLDSEEGFVREAWIEYCKYLMGMVSSPPEEAPRATPIINATAGFKAFLPYAMLAGYYCNARVFYQFEQHSTILEMPQFLKSSDEEFAKEVAGVIEHFINWRRESPDNLGPFLGFHPKPPTRN